MVVQITVRLVPTAITSRKQSHTPSERTDFTSSYIYLSSGWAIWKPHSSPSPLRPVPSAVFALALANILQKSTQAGHKHIQIDRKPAPCTCCAC